MKHRMQLL